MIPVFKPTYNKTRILRELEEIFDKGWTGLGPKTEEFEAAVAVRLNAPYGVFLNSCTSALHLALECLNLPKGSYVAVPDITFVSTASAVVQAGLRPVILPVDDFMQIDLDSLATWVDRGVIECVVPVHYSGSCCNMDLLMHICRNIHVVEDCAHAMGSSWKGKPLGTFGDMGCFSFHAVKNLPIGDGGMVVGKPEYEKDLRQRRWLGIDKSTYQRTGKTYSYSYDIGDLGFKYHGNDIMAVIGLANLELLDAGNARRREIYTRYRDLLPDKIIYPHANVKSSHHLVACRMPNRDAFIDHMAGKGIAIGVHYKPVSSFDYYRRFATPRTAERSLRQFRQLATLPCFPSLSDEQLNYVCDCITQFTDPSRASLAELPAPSPAGE